MVSTQCLCYGETSTTSSNSRRNAQSSTTWISKWRRPRLEQKSRALFIIEATKTSAKLEIITAKVVQFFFARNAEDVWRASNVARNEALIWGKVRLIQPKAYTRESSQRPSTSSYSTLQRTSRGKKASVELFECKSSLK